MLEHAGPGESFPNRPGATVSTTSGTTAVTTEVIGTTAGGPSRADAYQVARRLVDALDQVLLGAGDVTRLVVAALLARGHVLLEDRPGVGKTLLAKALAASIGGTSARVQGSIDVLPADITGTMILDRSTGTSSESFRFLPGPVFNNVVILDELNRISPRAQAALLEAMEERQVTVDGVSRPLPDPFLVIATQNHTSTAGTYPLLQGQLDRFTVGLSLGLPSAAQERSLLLGTGGNRALAHLQPVATASDVRNAQARCEDTHVASPLADYVVALTRETRRVLGESHGASPRAALMVVGLARAIALLEAREYVIPDDIQSALFPVFGMRLFGDSSEADARQRVAGILAAVPVPVP